MGALALARRRVVRHDAPEKRSSKVFDLSRLDIWLLGTNAIIVIMLAVIGQRWDLSRMNTGANVYFSPGYDRHEHQLVIG